MYAEDKFEMITNLHVDEVSEDEYTMTMEGIPIEDGAEDRRMMNFGKYVKVDMVLIGAKIYAGKGSSIFNLGR